MTLERAASQPRIVRPRILSGPPELAPAGSPYTAEFTTGRERRSAPALRVEIGDSSAALLLAPIPAGLDAHTVQLRERDVALGEPIELDALPTVAARRARETR